MFPRVPVYTLAAMGTGSVRYSKERCGAGLEGRVQLCWLSEQTPPLFILGQREIFTGFVLGLVSTQTIKALPGV